MPVRTVTLSQLRTDISDQASFTIGENQRYTPTLLTRLINQSLQRFRSLLSNEGATHILTHTTGNLGTAATSPFPFWLLDYSSVSPAVVQPYGLDITVDSETRTLLHIPFEHRSEYAGPLNTGTPQAWASYTRGSIAVLPPSSSAYAYVLWYLPVLADLSADSDTFEGVSGWEEWVMWDVVCKLITRDTYAGQYQMANNERIRVQKDIVRYATRVTQAGGARIGRDTMGERMNGRRRHILPRPT